MSLKEAVLLVIVSYFLISGVESCTKGVVLERDCERKGMVMSSRGRCFSVAHEIPVMIGASKK